jgi:hypothetical protein
MKKLLVFPTIPLGIVAIACWIVLFGLGLFINSGIYRNTLTSDFNWNQFAMSILTYTPTNIAMLCLVSALSGGCASNLVVMNLEDTIGTNVQSLEGDKLNSHVYMKENPFSSLLRGVVVYFAFLAGVYIASNAPFSNPTPEQYAKTAGAISLLSFAVGYDPTIFRSIIGLGKKIKTP